MFHINKTMKKDFKTIVTVFCITNFQNDDSEYQRFNF